MENPMAAIEADGDKLYNFNGTYGTMSDARLTGDCRCVSSQWDDVKELQVRNFTPRWMERKLHSIY